MTLRLDFDGIADGTTMAQASTLVPVTKMKKAQAWTLALSWGYEFNKESRSNSFSIFFPSIYSLIFFNAFFLFKKRSL